MWTQILALKALVHAEGRLKGKKKQKAKNKLKEWRESEAKTRKTPAGGKRKGVTFPELASKYEVTADV